MEKINLEALRQCFIDPDVRIKQMKEVITYNFPRIKKVQINSGFLEGQEIEFHPGLTSILGGKGTGKSLLIEFMRFALNQEPTEPTLKKDHNTKLKLRLEDFGEIALHFMDENGNVSIVKRQYREADNSPFDDDIPYDPAQVFPVLFLSQNEIIKIAEIEDEQLKFIDRFFDFHNFTTRIQSIEIELKQLDRLMADGLLAITEYNDLSNRISTFEKEITKLDEALKHPIFHEFQKLEEKEKSIVEQQQHISNLSEFIDKSTKNVSAIQLPSIPPDLSSDPALLRNYDLLKKTKENTIEVLTNLNASVADAKEKALAEYRTWR